MGDSLQTDSLLDQLLEEVHQLRLILSGRLGSLENSVCFLSNTCNGMVTKLDSVESVVQRTQQLLQAQETVMATQSSDHQQQEAGGDGGGVLATSSGVLSLPGVEDYPEGTWLGDPDSPGNRVRSPITPQNLLHINSTCVTAEKMALTLLDYLFSRDELASSNISGRSRNNKKQLDPMMVYGIRCHLQYKFNITAKEWNRICQNIDSKCRSAWKRKIKNMQQPPSKIIKLCQAPLRPKEPPLTEDIAFDFDQLHSSNIDLSCVKVMSDSPCELRILHSAASGLDPDSHEIVLTQDRILTAAVEDKNGGLLVRSSSNSNSSMSMTPVVMTTNQLQDTSSSLRTTTLHHHHHHHSSSDATPLDVVASSSSLHNCCSVSLASSSLSLEHSSDDPSEGVIVIAGDPAPDDDEDVVEIGVGDSLHHHHHHLDNDDHHHPHHHHLDDDDRPADSPSPPSSTYKLLPHAHSSFHQSLQLHSSTIKHEMDGQDIANDLDESMQSIHHQSALHHLNINSLGVMRVKDDMDIKEEATRSLHH